MNVRFCHPGSRAERPTLGPSFSVPASSSRAVLQPENRRGQHNCVSVVAMAAIITLFGVAHAAQLSLTWTDTSTNEDGFKIERKTGTASAFGQLASVPAESTGYLDTTVTAGTMYCYRVRAYNSAGDSGYSNEACATPVSATLYTVTVSKPGTGIGTVTSSPAGIDCGAICDASIASGTSIALSAAAATGSIFAGWSGASCSGTGSCAFTVSANTTVTANFAPNSYVLAVTKSGTGSGTVTSSPTGVNCGSTCSATYNYNAFVTLTAVPSTGSTFTGWSGGCAGTATTCTVSMTAARSVTATFAQSAPTAYLLSVTKTGTGSGSVTSSPTGVTCGSTCSASFSSGASVTLTAVPSTGSTFTGWSGGGCTGTGTCTVTMSAAQTVAAAFTVTPPPSTYPLSVIKNGAGAGTVVSNPGGIDCGTTCSASFAGGAAVGLTAIPESGSTFAGWSGACTGSGACTVGP